MCDPNYGKVGDKATSLILTSLVKKGLSSPVKEVQEIRYILLLYQIIINSPSPQIQGLGWLPLSIGSASTCIYDERLTVLNTCIFKCVYT